MKSHVLGFPRIGDARQLKRAVEAYWNGKISQQDLIAVQQELEKSNWEYQCDSGLDYVTVGDFSFYDNMLDTSIAFGVIPQRFIAHEAIDENLIDTMFCMGRGRAPNGQITDACEMTKWFDTNYHYIVPEFSENQTFSLQADQLLDAIVRAQQVVGNQEKVKPVIIGPLTFLRLGKMINSDANRLDLLPDLIVQYTSLFKEFAKRGVSWVQVDEPILVLDLEPEWLKAFTSTYESLDFSGVNPLLTTYFGAISENLETVKSLPVSGLHIDAIRAPEQVAEIVNIWPSDKVLSIGVVNGRNIWKNDMNKTVISLQESVPTKQLPQIWIGTSCSLLHSPVDLNLETKLDPEIRSWLSFARQKIGELVAIQSALEKGRSSVHELFVENAAAIESRKTSTKIHNELVQKENKSITSDMSRRISSYETRARAQQKHLKLPLFPTTTIGSFSQTAEIRSARRKFKLGQLNVDDYKATMKSEIQKVVAFQETLGLDLLVHGEAERNDMVEYFGEQLEGFTFTQYAWVQSYGSRCVKPPIIFGDVCRPTPMTLEWTTYAQSLTSKPMKGMLTGPVTMLLWSFVRDDQPLQVTARQIALAIRHEVVDLEKAGIHVIQIDEPAFREGLPLRKQEQENYLKWATEAFRISSCGVRDNTQIHTHMCYAEFNAIIDAIAELDADVISIESSRSKMELLEAFKTFRYPNSIGPGVYDIHSPNVPSVDSMVALLHEALKYVPKEKIHVNPDCGLKTRKWQEIKASLTNMMTATKLLRAEFADAHRSKHTLRLGDMLHHTLLSPPTQADPQSAGVDSQDAHVLPSQDLKQ